MSTEWIAPVVTGAVGIAGVTGTFLTARQSRQSTASEAAAQRTNDREQRERDEKRDAYVAYLTLIATAKAVFDDLGSLRSESGSEAEARTMRKRAMAELRVAREQVRLVGPPLVRRTAGGVYDEVLASLREAPTTSRAKWPHHAVTHLLAVMKHDLGYEMSTWEKTLVLRTIAHQKRAEDQRNNGADTSSG